MSTIPIVGQKQSNIAERSPQGDNLNMRATLDEKRRAISPPQFSSGDIVDIELQGSDVLIVRRMRQVLRPKPKLVFKRRLATRIGCPLRVSLELETLLPAPADTSWLFS